MSDIPIHHVPQNDRVKVTPSLIERLRAEIQRAARSADESCDYANIGADNIRSFVTVTDLQRWDALLAEATPTPPLRAHIVGCQHALGVPVDRCECGGRDFAPPRAGRVPPASEEKSMSADARTAREQLEQALAAHDRNPAILPSAEVHGVFEAVRRYLDTTQATEDRLQPIAGTLREIVAEGVGQPTGRLVWRLKLCLEQIETEPADARPLTTPQEQTTVGARRSEHNSGERSPLPASISTPTQEQTDEKA